MQALFIKFISIKKLIPVTRDSDFLLYSCHIQIHWKNSIHDTPNYNITRELQVKTESK